MLDLGGLGHRHPAAVTVGCVHERVAVDVDDGGAVGGLGGADCLQLLQRIGSGFDVDDVDAVTAGVEARSTGELAAFEGGLGPVAVCRFGVPVAGAEALGANRFRQVAARLLPRHGRQVARPESFVSTLPADALDPHGGRAAIGRRLCQQHPIL